MHCKAKHDEDRIEQEVLIEVLRGGSRGHRSRTELERALNHLEPWAIGAALERLHERDLLRVEGETVEAPSQEEQSMKIELLAAVVLHTLVRAHPHHATVEEVARECERDPAHPDERTEVELALLWLVGDDLALERDEGFVATRAAVRAEELSF